MFKLHRPIVVDTETYYDSECSIRANKRGWVGGNYHYTHHPKFYCYMLSWFDIETGECGVIDDPVKIAGFIMRELPGRTIIAHNAGFDIAVCKTFGPFDPLNTFDTADMASYLQSGRSLDVASLVLLNHPVDKGMREFMSGKHYCDLSDNEKTLMKAYALSDAKVTADLFIKYHEQMPPLEQWMSNFTRCQNEAGVHIDQDYLQDQIDKVSAIRSSAKSRIPWAEEFKPLSPKQLAVYCREVGIEPPTSLAEDSDECQAWENKYGGTFPVVNAMRDFRKSNTYLKKLQLIEALIRPDGTIPLATKYAAAPHTLRFSATQFNYQSLPRDTHYCDLRGCLVPAPGHKFVGSDLAGIEARCLPWLAGDTAYLDAVAKLDREAEASGTTGGGDIYEPAARRMFGYSEAAPLRKSDKDLRNATKICVLQLGYQSGASKFLWFTENNVATSVLDRVRQQRHGGGLESNAELTARLVQLYRSMNPKVQSLWYGLDNELRQAAVAGLPFKVQQPNGRVVYYWNLGFRRVVKPDGKERHEVAGVNCRGDAPVNLYGGKLTENICQEMARHVLVHTIYNLTQAGFRIRMSIHDENVVEVPIEQATPENLRRIERIMSETPAWAPGLPLAASTGIMDRYTKD